ncbi:MAG: OprD family outer membrane porin [Azonexus sp.]|nr:OprD family outer membrane porin [Azonexus sp.]
MAWSSAATPDGGPALFARHIACLAALCASPVWAGENLPEADSGSPLAPFFADAELTGNLFFFYRDRQRYRVDTGHDETILHHATMQSNVEFSSGFIDQTIGLDLGYFATADSENSGYPVHEISFFPWRNPWSPDFAKKDTRSGGSLYKAHLKIQHGAYWARLGYFQPTGPGVLGVNWSLLPGAYLGGESGWQSGPLTVAAAYATQYKAPWYQDTYHFKKNDGLTDVAYLWSLGGRYAFSGHLTAELAYGQSQHYLKNAHFKVKYAPEPAWYLSYQLYLMGEHGDNTPGNEHFASTASQHYLAVLYQPRPWSLKAEFLHSRAPTSQPGHAGYFAYRLIGAYGGANGAYEPWWDSRSDWNHNHESALFTSLGRTLDDFGWNGWRISFALVRGWGGRVYGYAETLNERAYTADIGYTINTGRFSGTQLQLHYIHYDNQTRLPSWTGFKNAFQDERDLKFIISIPWRW